MVQIGSNVPPLQDPEIPIYKTHRYWEIMGQLWALILVNDSFGNYLQLGLFKSNVQNMIWLEIPVMFVLN